MENIEINTEYIKLDQFLKWVGVAESGSEAKLIISDGLVKINGRVIQQRGKKIFPGDQVEIELDEIVQFVVRGTD